MQPRRHRVRKPARLASAQDWVRSGALVTVGTYARRYGVDRYTAYDELTAIGFALPATASRWALRLPPVPRKKRRRTDELDDTRFADPDWVWVGDRRMFVVGHTAGGAPFGVWEDEIEDSPQVVRAVGLDPDTILTTGTGRFAAVPRQRRSSWTAAVLTAWNRQCAFCGFDGQLGATTVGVEAAHVRWFSFGGPDDPDNGLALCSLHHKLFDRGALGLSLGDDLRIAVSASFTSRTNTGQAVYDLHRRPLNPRPGTTSPAEAHIVWHTREVFKGPALNA